MPDSEKEPMNKYHVGGKYYYRLLGGMKVTITIHKIFLFFCLIEYSEGRRWAYPDPFVYSQKIKWGFTWRLLDE